MGARERWVRTGGVELCVAELGDDRQPTVVLVHGYPDTKEVWSEVAARLADRFHVVLYDVRGHGRSTAPRPLRGGFTLEKLTDDFLAVADAVSPDRPVHLVGHDWGSVQSWEFVTVARTEGRIASFTSMSGPSLDHFGHWIKQRTSRGPPRAGSASSSARAPSPGTCTCCTRPCCRSSPGAARSASGGRRSSSALEKVPAGDYPTAVAALGRRARRLALPRQRPGPAAPAARGRVRARARAADHAPGDAFLSERLYDELEQWAPELVRRTLAGQALGPAHPARPAGRLDQRSS